MFSRLRPFLFSLASMLWADESASSPSGSESTTESADASFLPQQAVEAFTLPRFNPEGDKSWEIRGETAVFVSAGLIRIENFVIEVLSPAGGVSTLVRSPQAEIDLENRAARGNGFISIDGPGFTVDGNQWTWDGKNRRIRIEDYAVVRLQDSIGGFLK